MIKILMIEDQENEKVSKVIQGLKGQATIDHVLDVNSALEKIKKCNYQLIITDILIPMQFGVDQPSTDNSRILLDQVIELKLTKLPFILGLTSIEENQFQKIKEYFELKTWSILRFSNSSNVWLQKIKGLVASISSFNMNVDIAIFTALYTPEYSELEKNFENLEVIDNPQLMFKYKIGTYNWDGVTYSILIGTQDSMGNVKSSLMSNEIIKNFNPKFIGMCGIAAAIDSEIKLGDLLVTEKVWDYGAGKLVEDEGKVKLIPTIDQVSVSPKVERYLKSFVAKDIDKIVENSYAIENDKISVRKGDFASGAAVVDSQVIVRHIKEQHRKVIGLEMEIYGFYKSCVSNLGINRNFDFLAVKSAVDKADGTKNDKYQRIGSRLSGAYLLEFACSYLKR